MKFILAALSVCGVLAISEVANAQRYIDCSQFPRGERRNWCLRQAEQAAREEQRTWNEAERDIEGHICNGAGDAGRLRRVPRQVTEGGCQAYFDGQRAYDDRQRRAGRQDHSPEAYFRDSRQRYRERQDRFDREQERYRRDMEERRRRRR